jgi:hypothetical protein
MLPLLENPKSDSNGSFLCLQDCPKKGMRRGAGWASGEGQEGSTCYKCGYEGHTRAECWRDYDEADLKVGLLRWSGYQGQCLVGSNQGDSVFSTPGMIHSVPLEIYRSSFQGPSVDVAIYGANEDMKCLLGKSCWGDWAETVVVC